MTDPKARERLVGILGRWTSCADTAADAILAAFPELTAAPGKDVVEGAKEVVEKWLGRFIPADDQFGRGLPRLEGLIAAFATACVARERARWIKSPEESQRMLAADALRARRTP